jgi:hypothetical protein
MRRMGIVTGEGLMDTNLIFEIGRSLQWISV